MTISPQQPEKKSRSNGEQGVSEVIGVVLLLSIVALAVAIIATQIYAQPLPQQIPDVKYQVSTSSNGTLAYLYHDGGDSLNIGTFQVMVDSVQKTATLVGGGTTWSVGTTLQVPITQTPQKIQILYYYNGRNAVPIHQSASGSFTTPTLASQDIPVIPTAVATPIPNNYIYNDAANISNSSFFIDAIQQNLSSHSISFMKADVLGATNLYLGSCSGLCYDKNTQKYQMHFTVTDTTLKSTFAYQNANKITNINLSYGDVVTIYLDQNNLNYFTLFGIAPAIWELNAYPVSFKINFISGNVTSVNNTKIDHVFVKKYSNFGSTLAIDVAGTSDTALLVNGTQYINSPDSQDIAFTNVQPVAIGLYLISIQGSGNTLYFVGNADQIYYNGQLQSLL